MEDSAIDYYSPLNWGRESIRLPPRFAERLELVERVCEGSSVIPEQRGAALLAVAKAYRLLGELDAAERALKAVGTIPLGELRVRLFLERGRVAQVAGNTSTPCNICEPPTTT